MKANLMLAVAAVVLGVEARSTLPVGYQEVEYFSSTKTTVKTGYTPEVTDRVETKVYITGTSGTRGIFCARKNSSSVGAFTCLAGLEPSSYSVRSDYGNYDASRLVSGFKQSADMTVVFNNDAYQSVLKGQGSSGNILTKTVSLYDGTGGTVTTFDNNEGVVGSELLLFALHNGDVNTPTSSTYGSWMRCYYFRVYDRYGKLKMNLVPCKNLMTTETANNKIYGFYDTVRQRFLEPTFGTDGSCSVGGEVYERDVEDLQELKYAESTGGQWIRTMVKPNWNDRVELEASFPSSLESMSGALYWCRGKDGTKNVGQFDAFLSSVDGAGKMKLRIDRYPNSTTTSSGVVSRDSSVHLITYNGATGKAAVDTKDSGLSMGTSEYTPAGPLAIFAAHSAGTGLNSGSISAADAYAKPWQFVSLKLLSAQGEMRMHLVPCRDGDEGTVGLYDRVSGKFYTPIPVKNATASHELVAGPLVACATNKLALSVNAAGTSADLTFDASTVARKLVLAYGNTDAAGAFHAWENHAAEIEIAAGETDRQIAIPAGFGTEYRVVRAFLGAVVSSDSVFAKLPVTAKVTKEAGVPVSADLTFTGSEAARRLFLVWGPKDVGNVLTGWVGKVEIEGGIPAGVTSLANVAIPQAAQDDLAQRGGFRFVIGDVATEKSYVQGGLFLQYDGINNAGIGRHSKKFDLWSDLVSSNDISVVEKDDSYDSYDQICDTYVKIRRHTRATAYDVIDARPDVQLTMESCMRPVAHNGESNVATIDLRYYGYMGWDKRETGSMMLCRPVSTSRKQRDLRKYDIGGASLQALIDAAAFNTYSVTFGYGTGTSSASLAYFDGELCGPHGTGSDSDSSDWSRQLKLGFQKSVTDIASVRLYDRELSLEDRRWNVAVDEERFRGGDPASLQSTDFIRRGRGLIIVVE